MHRLHKIRWFISLKWFLLQRITLTTWVMYVNDKAKSYKACIYRSIDHMLYHNIHCALIFRLRSLQTIIQHFQVRTLIHRFVAFNSNLNALHFFTKMFTFPKYHVRPVSLCQSTCTICVCITISQSKTGIVVSQTGKGFSTAWPPW